MRCVKCDGRLGVQNPGYLCDTCKWITNLIRYVCAQLSIPKE